MARKKNKEGNETDAKKPEAVNDDDLEEKSTPAVAANASAEPAPLAADEDFTPEDESKYAFPMAPIVRLMKMEMDQDKMIRRRVKEGMNQWLEGICRKVAKKMNQSEYTMVEIDDFKTAIEAYEMIDSVEQERARIVATLEKVKQDCDSLIMDVNRKFITP
jgi:histone H3/H4